MNRFIFPSLRFAAALAAATAFSRASADTIFQFGPGSSYVSGNVDFSRADSDYTEPAGVDIDDDGSANDMGAALPFSDSVVANPGGYSGPDFYAGYVSVRSPTQGGAGLMTGQVRNRSPADTIAFQTGSGAEGDLHALVLFPQYEFASGFDSGPVGFDATSSATGSTRFSRTFNGDEFENGLRLVVRNRDPDTIERYYISEAKQLPSSDGATFAFNDLYTGSFRQHDFTSDVASLDLDWDGATTFGTLGSAFQDITGLGFFVQYDNSTGSLGNQFELESLTVTGIPEPGTLALVLVCAIPILVLLRGRRV